MALTDKLSAIGDAIRSKTGKEELLTLDEMPNEIEGISGENQIDNIIKGELIDIYSESETCSAYAFYNSHHVKSIDMPNVINIGSSPFSQATELVSISCPKLSIIPERFAWVTSKLSSVNLPNATEFGAAAFYGTLITEIPNEKNVTMVYDNVFYNTKITNVYLPSVIKVGYAVFQNCSLLVRAEFGEYHENSVAGVRLSLFQNCSQLETVIFRAKTLLTLQSINAFQGTPIEAGTGYIYVPKALIEDYKVATNWITFAEQFRAIEDYPDICGGAE